jgi:hypothetical protein
MISHHATCQTHFTKRLRSSGRASCENHWQVTAIGCEDVIGGRLRSGWMAGLVTAIVPVGPAPVYTMLMR